MSHEEATHLKYTVKPFHSAGKSPGKYKPGSRCHSKYEFVRQEKIEAVVPQIPRMEPEGKRERCGIWKVWRKIQQVTLSALFLESNKQFRNKCEWTHSRCVAKKSDHSSIRKS